MAGDVNPQPGAKFDPGKSYLVKGDLLNRLLETARPVRAGEGLKEFQSAKGKVISLAREAIPNPFESYLIASGAMVEEVPVNTYYAQVAEGEIIERNMAAGEGENSIIRHKAINHRDANGVLTKFALTEGQGVFITVHETPYGHIDATEDVLLSVLNVPTVSTNFIPGIQDGVSHYLIAELKNVGGVLKLVPVCGGSNIFHQSGLTADSVLRSCPFFEPGASEATPGQQLLRLSHVSGSLASIGESIEDRPLAEIHEVKEIDAEVCC